MFGGQGSQWPLATVAQQSPRAFPRLMCSPPRERAVFLVENEGPSAVATRFSSTIDTPDSSFLVCAHGPSLRGLMGHQASGPRLFIEHPKKPEAVHWPKDCSEEKADRSIRPIDKGRKK